MRLKHNKKRNVAFVYEALVRELTRAVIKKSTKRKNNILSIIKEHFSANSLLVKELGLYQTIYETKNVNRNLAEKLLIESRIAHDNIDKRKLFAEQSALIRTINKTISSNIFNNFVPNYRSIASAYSIFNSEVPTKQRVLLEEKMIENMSSSIDTEPHQRKEHIDNIVYKTFVEKFNQQYGSTLLEEQKQLLSKFVASFSDNGIELKVFMNEEVGRLKKELSSSISNEDIISDDEMRTKAEGVIAMLEGFKEEKIDDGLVEKTLKIQNLVDEMTNVN